MIQHMIPYMIRQTGSLVCRESSAHLSTSQSRYDRVALLCTLKRSDSYSVDSWHSPTINEGNTVMDNEVFGGNVSDRQMKHLARTLELIHMFNDTVIEKFSAVLLDRVLNAQSREQVVDQLGVFAKDLIIFGNRCKVISELVALDRNNGDDISRTTYYDIIFEIGDKIVPLAIEIENAYVGVVLNLTDWSAPEYHKISRALEYRVKHA